MKAIADLEALGYVFWLEGEAVRFSFTGDADARPDPAQVRPVLNYIKRHKAEATEFLRWRAGEALAEAQALLDCYAESGAATWARRWAALAGRAGWPCFGFARWERWAAAVAAGYAFVALLH